jgi:hypothetical protein
VTVRSSDHHASIGAGMAPYPVIVASSRTTSLLISVVLWLGAAAITALTIWFSLVSAPPDVGSDKDLHAVAYFANTFALLAAVGWRPNTRAVRLIGLVALIVIGMLTLGASLELIQRYVGRNVDRQDLYADAFGVGAAMLAFVAVRTIVMPFLALAPSSRR